LYLGDLIVQKQYKTRTLARTLRRGNEQKLHCTAVYLCRKVVVETRTTSNNSIRRS